MRAVHVAFMPVEEKEIQNSFGLKSIQRLNILQGNTKIVLKLEKHTYLNLI
jgi:hypothetical protein